MADLNDVVTVQKNGVIAVNNLNQTEATAWIDNSSTPGVPYLKTISENVAIIAGGAATSTTSATVSSTSLIVAGSGTLFNFSVVVAGTANGLIYNSATVGGIAASNALAMAPNTGGVFPVNPTHFSNGLVVAPGTGQSINVTYTLD